jgi:chromate transporter
VLFAYGLITYGNVLGSGWLHGLKSAAVAVVAVAVLGMARSLTPDRERASIAVAAAAIALAVPTAWGQIGAIVAGGIAGLVFLRDAVTDGHVSLPLTVTRRQAIVALVIFFVLLIGLPLIAANTTNQSIKLFDAFYRAGSLVFGGGHVVLPLLQAEVVPPGWLDNDTFLAGYGAAQAVPGPLFTFAAFLGTVMKSAPNGLAGAALCLVAIFVSSFLLVVAALPFWEALRLQTVAQSLMRGVNAAVVGLLLAALYNPVWTTGILNAKDFALAVTAFLFLFMWQTPPWLVVVGCAVGGGLISAL